jgi:hypothetical protein
VVALLGGIGVGAVSVNHINYNTPNAHACYAYWQLKDSGYALMYPAGSEPWYELVADAPKITDPTLSNAVQVFNDELFIADWPDSQTTAVTIESSCNAMGYINPS